MDTYIPHTGSGAIRVPANQVPQPATTALGTPDATGFNGLSHHDQRFAGTGGYTNTQFSLEPPDQMLCAGNGYVLEGVNNALRVHNAASGAALTDPTAFSQFWGLNPEIVRSTPLVFGPFISDPKCYYDAGSQRFFITELEIATDPSTGDFGTQSWVLIAVSATGDPTGTWNLYSIDTTNSGLAGHPGCPCFGDQPLIGADANGFYVSTNEFSIAGPEFNGAQVYALDKAALAAGSASVNQAVINTGQIATPDTGGIWYSIQPATTPPGGAYASNTEYFLSALQFGPSPLDNRIAVWALTGTNTLSTTPSVSLSHAVLASEVYGMPPASDQKGIVSAALTPLAHSLKDKLEFLNTNDDRMNQVVYAAGTLWSGLNTAVAANGSTRSGIAWFAVTPSVTSGQVAGTVAKQGYIALQQDSVMFPSIGVNASGNGAVAFSVAGPDFYPSTGYAKISLSGGVGPVHVAGSGAGPEDGFSGYLAYGGSGRVARWGDYSAAVAVEDGSIWTAAEYIPGTQRSLLANWGTYVSHVTP